MRTIRYVIFSLIVASNTGMAGTSALSLKLIALDSSVKSGSRVMIQVTTTNDSTHEITYHNTNRCDYSLKVTTKGGALAAETPVKKDLDCSSGKLKITGRDIVVTLKPGESHSEQIEITELYHMSVPGEYVVQVERTYADIGHFRSNSVSVTVTE